MSPGLPHDPTDLLLAPVALAIDTRLRELAGLDHTALTERITVETNMSVHSRDDAQRAVIETVTYLIDTHDWDVTWDERGILLTHNAHRIALGLPPNVRDFVATAGRPLAAQA